MKLKQFAAAFLFNENDEVLLLQKKVDAKFLAGKRVPIGGHMEIGEMNDPQSACFREIHEETGLSQEQVDHVTLKYVVHRMQEDYIYIQFIYIGKLQENVDVIDSDEGELIWVPSDRLEDENVTEAIRELARHYGQIGQYNDEIYVGVMLSNEGQPQMSWSVVQDWERLSAK
ncbi:NUDIX hydrolase [Alkalibacillus haloalkaliphilus]|uniref:NUDIX hydrolase n=1 Tax=Alkalibacillus haloalkaliphilus TaxID=94136 RepID=UPI002936D52A|nr:NUDIX domain-containing protein [Alkalibacillus haloalkaliphilus]MDV2582930.1 NUDIX domain-containing protein [Alkalibacillus haloalkaliphilus]